MIISESESRVCHSLLKFLQVTSIELGFPECNCQEKTENEQMYHEDKNWNWLPTSSEQLFIHFENINVLKITGSNFKMSTEIANFEKYRLYLAMITAKSKLIYCF